MPQENDTAKRESATLDLIAGIRRLQARLTEMSQDELDDIIVLLDDVNRRAIKRITADRDEWKAAAQLRMTTGFAQGMRAQLQCQVRLDQAPEWLAGFDFAAEMFGEPRRLSGAAGS